MRERLFRAAKSMLGSREEAEDAMQDLFEKLWTRRDTLSAYENIEAMVYTAMRNSCLDRIRSRKLHREKAAVITAQTATAVHHTAEAVETNEVHAMIMSAIAELPAKQQMVIHLRDIEGCETEEIAKLTGMDETAIRVNLSRARKTVRDKIKKITEYGTR
jgi:RNA polymerase sigma-70 factor (ECF subfamily)